MFNGTKVELFGFLLMLLGFLIFLYNRYIRVLIRLTMNYINLHVENFEPFYEQFKIDAPQVFVFWKLKKTELILFASGAILIMFGYLGKLFHLSLIK